MIRLSRPDIRDEDIARAVHVLRSGMLVQGENVHLFEQQLSAFADLPHAVVVSSGTAALHLAVRALDLGPGDVVLAPAFTFPATANVIEAVGAETELCDVDSNTYVVTPETVTARVEELRGRRLKAVVVVHEFGYPARIEEIAEICRHHGLLLIEDAACALGARADGRHPGYYSDAACVSFHPRKGVTTGEGGAVITRRADVADEIVALRNHGIVRCDEATDFRYAGLNYRLTDFQAALALGQLERFELELARRRELAGIYLRMLGGVTGLSLPETPSGHALQSFMITLDNTISRKAVMAALLTHGIQTNLGAQALNCLSYFQNRYGVGEQSHPVASRLYHSGLVLPLYGALSASDVEEVCLALLGELALQGSG